MRQRADLRLVLNGIRDVVSVTGYWQKTETLNRGTAIVVGSTFDIVQTGGAIDVSHRLTSDLVGDLRIAGSNLRGLGLRSGDFIYRRTARVSVNRALSAKTTLTFAVNRSTSKTNFDDAGGELAVIAGLRVRF